MGCHVEMHKEKYRELMLRFAKELHDVGVTENMKKIIHDKIDRTPNVVSSTVDENIRKFHYTHGGYTIEAVQNIKIVIKTSK